MQAIHDLTYGVIDSDQALELLMLRDLSSEYNDSSFERTDSPRSASPKVLLHKKMDMPTIEKFVLEVSKSQEN